MVALPSRKSPIWKRTSKMQHRSFELKFGIWNLKFGPRGPKIHLNQCMNVWALTTTQNNANLTLGVAWVYCAYLWKFLYKQELFIDSTSNYTIEHSNMVLSESSLVAGSSSGPIPVDIMIPAEFRGRQSTVFAMKWTHFIKWSTKRE